jgi:A/G-specific adenine glycosylase
MNQRSVVQDLLAWFAANARALPWRRTRDPYAIWVSEIMLQQTQVKTVLPYWERWMAAMPDIASLARAKPEKLHKLWEGLGYYTRVRNIQKAAKLIVTEHDGNFPTNFEEVLALPGIGRYTAGAICSIAFNQPKPILDGNVIRVLTRLYGIEGKPREPKTNAELWGLAERLVSQAATFHEPSQSSSSSSSTRFAKSSSFSSSSSLQGFNVPMHAPNRKKASQKRGEIHTTHHAPRSGACSQFNQSLMELGALVCAPRQPKCEACPLSTDCVARREGRTSDLPNTGPKIVPTARHFVAFVAEKNGRFLVRQRPEGAVNGHLWEFPNLELTTNGAKAHGRAKILRLASNIFQPVPSAVELLCTIRHTITRYRIRLDVYRVSGNNLSTSPPSNGSWLSRGKLNQRPFTAAHKRVLPLLKPPSRP